MGEEKMGVKNRRTLNELTQLRVATFVSSTLQGVGAIAIYGSESVTLTSVSISTIGNSIVMSGGTITTANSLVRAASGCGINGTSGST
jgi:hypothetical protein